MNHGQADHVLRVSARNAGGSQDPPLFSRMPGFHICSYNMTEFDRYEFPSGPGKTEAVEGRTYHVIYYLNEGRPRRAVSRSRAV
jgi:hypothetical protein